VRNFLRRLRGIIGTGLTWAVGWAVLWSVPVFILSRFGVFEGFYLEVFLRAALAVAGGGFIAGSAFGVLLSAFERRKKLEDLSLKRISLLGGIGGLALAAIFGITLWAPILVLTVLGVGFASGTVALAKRADTKLIEGEEESVPSLQEDLEPERIG